MRESWEAPQGQGDPTQRTTAAILTNITTITTTTMGGTSCCGQPALTCVRVWMRLGALVLLASGPPPVMGSYGVTEQGTCPAEVVCFLPGVELL